MSSENCIVAFSDEPHYDPRGNEINDLSCNDYYVSSFDREAGRIETTRIKEEAKRFWDEIECDECMDILIRKKHARTVILYHYHGSNRGCECVHYPGRHWFSNNYLQPSMIGSDVGKFHDSYRKWDHKEGWSIDCVAKARDNKEKDDKLAARVDRMNRLLQEV